ncbi:peptide chain release factor N(5)-glutamine methyltransferase [Caldimonas tepidiphila]|uniref:peptide chain release factor N(5)-glutamine methyltransferase n=1 Tax=Caldimonas tepidiphila TaxID=2315841 RepID=UPI000E5A4952|nr:peptide chain release factor N(5)-glutamine methyltransferase [Caldimonas tepidiphila]
MATLRDALIEARNLGLERLDAQALLGHVLGRPRSWLLAHDGDALPEAEQRRYEALVRRRAAGEPFAYLVGEKEFWGLSLQVGPAVLVPRPDTETLVEWALECLHGLATPRVADLGTGSGAIALALKSARPDARICAVDLSPEALAIARGNAARLGLEIEFRAGHWWQAFGGEAQAGFELVVSNPPYIAEGDPHLPALRHEPGMALSSGADGLDAIREIVAGAPAHLAAGGRLLFEHGHDQGAAVRALLEHAGFAQVQTRRDLGGNERCTGGRLT